MVSLIAENPDGIRKLCAENYVKELYLFGSVTRGTDFSATSDVDFLCYYQPYADDAEVFARGDFWWELREGLHQLLGREVDVISADIVTNLYLIDSINRDKTLLYAA